MHNTIDKIKRSTTCIMINFRPISIWARTNENEMINHVTWFILIVVSILFNIWRKKISSSQLDINNANILLVLLSSQQYLLIFKNLNRVSLLKLWFANARDPKYKRYEIRIEAGIQSMSSKLNCLINIARDNMHTTQFVILRINIYFFGFTWFLTHLLCRLYKNTI